MYDYRFSSLFQNKLKRINQLYERDVSEDDAFSRESDEWANILEKEENLLYFLHHEAIFSHLLILSPYIFRLNCSLYKWL